MTVHTINRTPPACGERTPWTVGLPPQSYTAYWNGMQFLRTGIDRAREVANAIDAEAMRRWTQHVSREQQRIARDAANEEELREGLFYLEQMPPLGSRPMKVHLLRDLARKAEEFLDEAETDLPTVEGADAMTFWTDRLYIESEGGLPDFDDGPVVWVEDGVEVPVPSPCPLEWEGPLADL